MPFDLKKVNVGHTYNYFTSKIGFFYPDLEMNNKIGDSETAVIHWKGEWRAFYNVDNPRIYNIENITNKRRLYRRKDVRRLRKKIRSRMVGGKIS